MYATNQDLRRAARGDLDIPGNRRYQLTVKSI
jgi:hypothetical protein